MENKDYLTPEQVLERWGGSIHRQTLANWRHKKRGPAYCKIGGRVLYPSDKLLEWERANLKEHAK
jgi:hypothetical protein